MWLERTAELAALDRVVTALAAGEPSLVEIRGGFGTGRSALLARALELARGTGAVVLTAAGLPLAPEVDHRIVREVMAQLRRVAPGAATRGAVMPAGWPWEAAAPAGRRSAGVVVSHDLPSSGLLSFVQSGSCGTDAVCGVAPAEAVEAVLELARGTPVLLAVDDADGFDEPSRAWLTRLGERVGTRAIAIVTVTGLTRHVFTEAEVLTAGALSRDAVAEVVALRLGEPVAHSVVDALCRHTGGVPSVLHAVLDAMRLGAPFSAELVADAFGDVVVRAVAALPAEAGGLLRAIALCGPRTSPALAGAVAALRDVGAERAADLLAGAGLISPDRSSLAAGVDADRLLAGLGRADREALHLRAARLAHLAAVEASEVARLLEPALPLGEPWVVPLLRTAARCAVERGEPEIAVRHLERALREPVDPESRARLVLEIAVAESVHESQAGDRRLARMLLESQPPECAQARRDAVDQLAGRGDSTLMRRTLGAMPATDGERDRVTALYWLADEAPLEAPELGLLDVAPLPLAPQDPERAGVSAWLCVARSKDAALARGLARTALAAPDAMLMPRVPASVALWLTGDVDEALAGLDGVVLGARERGLNAVESHALVVRAKLMLAAGRLVDAGADLEAARTALPPRYWHDDVRSLLVAAEVQLSLERGLVDRAEDQAGAVPEHLPGAGFVRALMMLARADLALRRGDPDTALSLAEECGRRMLAKGWSSPAVLPWRSLCARALHAKGDVDRAVLLCGEEIDHARSWGEPGLLGVAHLRRAGVSGDHEDVLVAARLLRNSPYRLAYAAALFELAEAGGDREVRPLVREAAEIAVRARVPVLLSRARRLGWVPGA